ncbi:hypothetical protein BKA56DRAFT_40996 [Ilyonectria sp. MPI-CAGE-AT-0026]|nr:hypothetical protein BKA56DRAFT_40996 [Ilyonectria sp. MPI-CAGE-AT-0026]
MLIVRLTSELSVFLLAFQLIPNNRSVSLCHPHKSLGVMFDYASSCLLPLIARAAIECLTRIPVDCRRHNNPEDMLNGGLSVVSKPPEVEFRNAEAIQCTMGSTSETFHGIIRTQAKLDCH